MKKFYLFFVIALFVAQTGTAQNSKIEERFLSKQIWTVRDVKSSRPYFEIGEKLTFRVDKSFYHDRNNYAKMGGTWSINGKELVLSYDSFIEERRRIPYEFKVKKWKDSGIRLTWRNRNNKKEKIFLR
jgi:hypothetical protein